MLKVLLSRRINVGGGIQYGWRNSKDLLKWDVLIGYLIDANPIGRAVRLINMGMYAK